ncbi:MucB/RseB C-terminal domain-containing protein [Formivibrio citricus]|nr:MucB/RseB C-terminal domain-containing protein [Formivibrio citricus]
MLVWLAGTAMAAGRLPDQQAVRLLQRMAQAPKQVSFHGVYVQQYGDSLETIRVCHVVENGLVNERRDSLDGPVREMVRQGDKVSLFVQGGGAFETQPDGRLFPALLPDDPTFVLENYTLHQAGRERVAGHEVEVYDLLPRDTLRFPHRLWMHTGSGLLLKASTTGYRRELYDLFAFSQLQLGGQIDRGQLKPVNPVKPLNASRLGGIDSLPAWGRQDSKAVPHGFKLVRQVLRPMVKRTRPVLHQVYSDGVVSVSVFAEEGRPNLPDGSGRQGALNVHSRQWGSVHVTAVGEVPHETLELFVRTFKQ